MDIETLLHEIEKLDPSEGISLLDVLELSEPLAKLIRVMIRTRPLTAAQLAAKLDLQPEAAAQITQLMADKGFLKVVSTKNETIQYRARFHDSGERGFANSVWDSFDS